MTTRMSMSKSERGSFDMSVSEGEDDDDIRQTKDGSGHARPAVPRQARKSGGGAKGSQQSSQPAANSPTPTDDGGDRKGGKSSRSRVHFSCTECHRRKQKCNRETPCQHCISRKIPERCVTFQPGEDPNDLVARVSRLERMVSENFDRMFSMLQRATGGAQSAGGGPSIASKGAGQWRTQAAPSTSENNTEGSEAGDEVVLYSTDLRPESSGYPTGNMTTRVNSLISDSMAHRSGKISDPLFLTDPMQHIEHAAQLDAVMFDYGATYSISQIFLAALPPRDVCDALIDHFFANNNWLRQPLSRSRFMRSYDLFWRMGPTMNIDNINVYATFMLTAAIGALTYRGEKQVSDDPNMIHLTAKRIFFAARHSLLISVMLGREDIQQVVAFHLASRFLFLDRRISEAWSCVANAVKTAHSIGLHRDGSLLNLPREECEARRRIWSIVYFGDRILCMNLGRPTAIDDCVVDTHLISEEDEGGEFAEYVEPLPGAIVPLNVEKPRFLTHTLMRHKLAVIMGKAIMIYQNVDTPAHYSDVVAVEHSLEQLHASFPDHLRTEFTPLGTLRHANTSWDNVYEFVAVHRYLQQAELLFVRMSLHRPYLIRPPTPRRSNSGGGKSNALPSHHRYNLSRRACIDAAYQTLMLRKDLADHINNHIKPRQGPPAWVSHLGSFNTLSAIVILCIYLLMEPFADDATTLLRPLRFFYDTKLAKKRAAPEQFDSVKEREFTILRMFLERIDEARAGKKKRTREDPERTADGKLPNRRGKAAKSDIQRDEDTAGVLLNLRKEVASPAADTGKTGEQKASAANPSAVDDGSLPWPYLPMRTPHHTSNGATGGAAVSGKGNGGSPYTVHSSSSVNNSTPPTSTMTGSMQLNGGGGSGDDGGLNGGGADGASVHQLFDSWFRYNAFENVDMMDLNSSMAAGAPPVLLDGSADTNGSSGNGSWPAAFAAGNGTGSRPRSPLPPPPGNVHWSTLPVPVYASSTSSGSATNATVNANVTTFAPNASAATATTAMPTSSFSGDAGLSAGIGIPPGPRNTFPDVLLGGDGAATTTTTTTGAAGETHAQQPLNVTAASYDPTFWQSLIDKISG